MIISGLAAAAGTALVLLEVELRRVELPPAVPGTTLSSRGGAPRGPHTLSSAGPAIEPLGPALRVQSGASAQWELELAQPPLWAQVNQGPARVQLPVGGGAQRWLLEASPQWRGANQPLLVQVQWQQPIAEGGSQRWRSSLPVREGLWVTLAREGGQAAVSAPGGLSTSATSTTAASSPARELQLRVRRVDLE